MSPSSTPRRRLLSVLTTVVTTAALAACGLSSNATAETASTDKPLVIGMSLPLTGPVADRSKPGLEGYQYWADELNAKGGLLGRKIKLKVLDDGFDQGTAVSGYNKLISQDKVDLLLGTFSSVLNLSVAPIAERNKYLYVEPSGGADEIFARNFNYLFFAQPATSHALPNEFLGQIAKMAAADRPRTVALVQQQDPVTKQTAAIFKEKLAALGVKAVYDSTYAPDTSNFDAIANSVKRAAPELVISGAVADDGIALIRAFQKAKFSPKMLFQSNSPSQATFASSIGDANTEAIFTQLAYSAAAPYAGNSEFVAGYAKKYGAAPVEDAANSYSAGQILAAAVTAVGKLDQPAMADWLHKNTVNTIVGPLSWDAAGRSQGNLLLGQWQSGKLEIVSPSTAATVPNVVASKPGWS